MICQIAARETEINDLVTEARSRSDERVRRRGKRLAAENELEEALVELKVDQSRKDEKSTNDEAT